MKAVDPHLLLIQQTGVRLCLSQETIATAMVYFNRFRQAGSISSFKSVESISACLFLASKVRDEIRKIRDILNCWKEASGKSFDTELTKEYYHLKERIVECEQVILRTFVFDVASSHPFVYYLNTCKWLNCSTECVQCGWSFLIDSYLYHVQEKYEPPVLAVSSIYLSMQMLHQPSKREEWWKLCDVTTEDLQKCCSEMLSLYED